MDDFELDEPGEELKLLVSQCNFSTKNKDVILSKFRDNGITSPSHLSNNEGVFLDMLMKMKIPLGISQQLFSIIKGKGKEKDADSTISPPLLPKVMIKNEDLTIKNEVLSNSLPDAILQNVSGYSPIKRPRSYSEEDRVKIRDDFLSLKDKMPPCAEKSILMLKYCFNYLESNQNQVKCPLNQTQISSLIETLATQLKNEKVFDISIDEMAALFNTTNSSVEYTKLFEITEEMLKTIRLIDVDALLVYLEGNESSKDTIAGKDVIILLGGTGTGKSTTIHHLAGSTFRMNGDRHLEVISSNSCFTDALKSFTMSQSTKSETRTLRSIEFALLDIGTKESTPNEIIIICDSPGFMDSDGIEANGVAIASVLKTCHSIRPLILISQNNLGDRCINLIQAISNFRKLFDPINDDVLNSFTYLFTKFDKMNKDILHKLILDKIRQTIWEKNDREVKKILEHILSKDFSSLYSDEKLLFLEPDNPSRPSSRVLIDLIMQQPPLLNPSEFIPTYLSASSLNQLELQMIKDLKTIQLALSRDDFDLVKYKLHNLSMLKQYLYGVPELHRFYEQCCEELQLISTNSLNEIDSFFVSFMDEKLSIENLNYVSFENSINLCVELESIRHNFCFDNLNLKQKCENDIFKVIQFSLESLESKVKKIIFKRVETNSKDEFVITDLSNIYESSEFINSLESIAICYGKLIELIKILKSSESISFNGDMDAINAEKSVISLFSAFHSKLINCDSVEFKKYCSFLYGLKHCNEILGAFLPKESNLFAEHLNKFQSKFNEDYETSITTFDYSKLLDHGLKIELVVFALSFTLDVAFASSSSPKFDFLLSNGSTFISVESTLLKNAVSFNQKCLEQCSGMFLSIVENESLKLVLSKIKVGVVLLQIVYNIKNHKNRSIYMECSDAYVSALSLIRKAIECCFNNAMKELESFGKAATCDFSMLSNNMMILNFIDTELKSIDIDLQVYKQENETVLEKFDIVLISIQQRVNDLILHVSLDKSENLVEINKIAFGLDQISEKSMIPLVKDKVSLIYDHLMENFVSVVISLLNKSMSIIESNYSQISNMTILLEEQDNICNLIIFSDACRIINNNQFGKSVDAVIHSLTELSTNYSKLMNQSVSSKWDVLLENNPRAYSPLSSSLSEDLSAFRNSICLLKNFADFIKAKDVPDHFDGSSNECYQNIFYSSPNDAIITILEKINEYPKILLDVFSKEEDDLSALFNILEFLSIILILDEYFESDIFANLNREMHSKLELRIANTKHKAEMAMKDADYEIVSSLLLDAKKLESQNSSMFPEIVSKLKEHISRNVNRIDIDIKNLNCNNIDQLKTDVPPILKQICGITNAKKHVVKYLDESQQALIFECCEEAEKEIQKIICKLIHLISISDETELVTLDFVRIERNLIVFSSLADSFEELPVHSTVIYPLVTSCKKFSDFLIEVSAKCSESRSKKVSDFISKEVKTYESVKNLCEDGTIKRILKNLDLAVGENFLGYSREYKDILEAVRSRFDTRIEEILKLEDVEDQLYEFEILILIGEKLPEKLLQFIDERTKDTIYALKQDLDRDDRLNTDIVKKLVDRINIFEKIIQKEGILNKSGEIKKKFDFIDKDLQLIGDQVLEDFSKDHVADALKKMSPLFESWVKICHQAHELRGEGNRQKDVLSKKVEKLKIDIDNCENDILLIPANVSSELVKIKGKDYITTTDGKLKEVSNNIWERIEDGTEELKRIGPGYANEENEKKRKQAKNELKALKNEESQLQSSLNNYQSLINIFSKQESMSILLNKVCDKLASILLEEANQITSLPEPHTVKQDQIAKNLSILIKSGSNLISFQNEADFRTLFLLKVEDLCLNLNEEVVRKSYEKLMHLFVSYSNLVTNIFKSIRKDESIRNMDLIDIIMMRIRKDNSFFETTAQNFLAYSPEANNALVKLRYKTLQDIVQNEAQLAIEECKLPILENINLRVNQSTRDLFFKQLYGNYSFINDLRKVEHHVGNFDVKEILDYILQSFDGVENYSLSFIENYIGKVEPNDINFDKFENYFDTFRSLKDNFQVKSIIEQVSSKEENVKLSFRARLDDLCRKKWDVSLNDKDATASVLIEMKKVGNKLPSFSSIIVEKIDEGIKKYKSSGNSLADKNAKMNDLGLYLLHYKNDPVSARELLKDSSLKSILINEMNEKFLRMGIDDLITKFDSFSTTNGERNFEKSLDEDFKNLRISIKEQFEIIQSEYNKIRDNGILNPIETQADIKSNVAQLVKDWKSKRVKPSLAEYKNTIQMLIASVFAYWSLEFAKESSFDFSTAEGKKLLKQPHVGQLVSIIILLGLSDNIQYFSVTDSKLSVSLPNQLCQIKTGEGKSVALGVTSVIVALLGCTVNCACYSKYLSKRDYDDFKILFRAFGVEKDISYGTFNELCSGRRDDSGELSESMKGLINTGGNIRKIVNDFVLPTGKENKLFQNDKTSEKPKVLLIDEVDVFFSKDFFGSSYKPLAQIKHENINKFINYIWTNKSNKDALRLSAIRSQDVYKDCVRVFGEERKFLFEEAMKLMIHDLGQYETHQYIIKDGKIAYSDQDGISFNISYGYETLFCLMKEMEKKNVTSDTVRDHMCITIDCGEYSYAEISKPGEYGTIMGVSGTLETIAIEQKKILEKNYNIFKYSNIPSVYSTFNLDFNESNARSVIIVESASYFNAICKEIENQLTPRTKSDYQRAVIVFFETTEKLDEFYNSAALSSIFSKEDVHILTEKTGASKKDQIIQEAVHTGNVTLMHRIFGRGTDFICFDNTLDSVGGVHVLQTFFSEDISEEIQIKGRTARQGKRGSYSMVLNESDLEKFRIQHIDLIEMKKSGEVYAEINIKRNKIFKESFPESLRKVESLQLIHNESMDFVKDIKSASKFAQWDSVSPEIKSRVLEFLKKRNKGPNTIKEEVKKWKVLILIDATCSMSHLIEQLKSCISELFVRLDEFITKREAGIVAVQLACYRNYNAGILKLFQHSSFETEPRKLQTFIDTIHADAGDGDESIEIGLAYAAEIPDLNQVILIGDAAPHSKEQVVERRKKNIGEHYWKNVKLCYWEDECIRLAKKKVVIDAFHINSNGEALFGREYHARVARFFNNMSEMTNGRCSELKLGIDGRGVEALHAVMTSVLKEVGGEELETEYRKKYGFTQ